MECSPLKTMGSPPTSFTESLAFTTFDLQGLAERDVDRLWRILHHSTDLPGIQKRFRRMIHPTMRGRSGNVVKVICLYIHIWVYREYTYRYIVIVYYLPVYLFICIITYQFMYLSIYRRSCIHVQIVFWISIDWIMYVDLSIDFSFAIYPSGHLFIYCICLCSKITLHILYIFFLDFEEKLRCWWNKGLAS